jgi:ribosomal protein S18 acetylase RimI-like enzyme
VRRAVPADAPALAALRAVMFDGMDGPAPDGAWQAAAGAWFARQLAPGAPFAAFVVEEPGAGVVSCACGVLDSRPPGPRGLGEVRGHVFNVATAPGHRRRGHARRCLEALLGWFAGETAAEVVELTASDDGLALYEALGFRARAHPTLRLGLRSDTARFL